MVSQGFGGSISLNLSKQSINPGKDFGPYGIAKASSLFSMKQYALEFGKYNIRVNGINADRIKSGLLTDQFIKERAKARNMSSTEYLNNNKIAMAITGKANATSVAEHVMTMMLCLTKNIFESDRLVKLGKFQEKGNLPNYFELYNKKILILG